MKYSECTVGRAVEVTFDGRSARYGGALIERGVIERRGPKRYSNSIRIGFKDGSYTHRSPHELRPWSRLSKGRLRACDEREERWRVLEDLFLELSVPVKAVRRADDYTLTVPLTPFFEKILPRVRTGT